MPLLVLPQPGRANLEPWMLLAFHFMFSTTGFFYALPLSPLEGQRAADALSKVWSDSSPAAVEEAKHLSNQLLDVVLESQLSTFFLGSCMLSFGAIAALVTKVIFLGRLSVTETSKLTERLMKFVMLKVVFFGAVVNPTYRDVGTWLTWFLAMGYLKMFVGLAGDRCEALLSSPSSTLLQHLRCLALLVGILVNLGGWMAEHVARFADDPNKLSAAALWLFDGATIVVEATHGIVKYGVHALERWRSLRAEKRGEDGTGPWEWQGSFLYHLELVADLTLHFLTLAHYIHLWFVHGLKFDIICMVLFLDVRYMVGIIWRRLRGFRRYRRLTAMVQQTFPDAGPEQLEGNECAICMERMKSAKVLPCRHIFHVSCLRAWLQQSRAGVFSCPMCRASLLVEGPADAQPAAAQQPQQQQQALAHAAPQMWPWDAPAAAEQGRGASTQQPAFSSSSSASLPVEAVGALLDLLSAQQRTAGPGGSRGEQLGAWAGSRGVGEGEALPDANFWAELDDLPSGWEAAGGISLTEDEGDCGQGNKTSIGPSISQALRMTLSACCHPRSGGSDKDLDDTAEGPSLPQPLRRAAAQHGEETARVGEGEGPAPSSGLRPGPRARKTEAATLTGSLAAASLRTLSRGVSHPSRSVGRRGYGEEGAPEDEEGAVDQPVSAQRPRPTHSYSTRSKNTSTLH